METSAVGWASIIDDLSARGLIQDSTDLDALRARLESGPITVYHGIDPSASSLHIGNFIGVLVLRRFQEAGHRPIVLVGGATGMVGDPGGRSEERNLLDEETLEANLAGIRSQLENLMDFETTTLVSNYDWTKDVTVLEFLRDVGKHATVNQMVARDSVRRRMESENGISFTEFSYMLLQAFDFWWLHENMSCELQVGGSDQWGNLAQGVDLIRRRSEDTAHALTWPLITGADGEKLGKTAKGAIWLDPARTLPYEFHQYWLNVDDRDAERFLLQLTLLDVAEVSSVMTSHREAPEKRVAQQRLADEVTALVHGPNAVINANRAAAILFGDEVPSSDDLVALRGTVPETTIDPIGVSSEEPLVDLLVASGLSSSRRDARQSIADGAIRWNGQRVAGDSAPSLDSGALGLLQKGKRNRHLVIFS